MGAGRPRSDPRAAKGRGRQPADPRMAGLVRFRSRRSRRTSEESVRERAVQPEPRGHLHPCRSRPPEAHVAVAASLFQSRRFGGDARMPPLSADRATGQFGKGGAQARHAALCRGIRVRPRQDGTADLQGDGRRHRRVFPQHARSSGRCGMGLGSALVEDLSVSRRKRRRPHQKLGHGEWAADPLALGQVNYLLRRPSRFGTVSRSPCGATGRRRASPRGGSPLPACRARWAWDIPSPADSAV